MAGVDDDPGCFCFQVEVDSLGRQAAIGGQTPRAAGKVDSKMRPSKVGLLARRHRPGKAFFAEVCRLGRMEWSPSA
jgi:hypothetical protein